MNSQASILINSLMLFTALCEPVAANDTTTNEDNDKQPQQLIGTWDCTISKTTTNGQVNIKLESNWTEELTSDGRITHNGVVQINVADDSATYRLYGEGFWHATDTTITSSFTHTDVKALSDGKLTTIIDVDTIENDFRKPGTEDYSINSDTFIRHNKTEDIRVVCTAPKE